MNRKNTILIAVIVNAGLLALLFAFALTMQEELPRESPIASVEPLELGLPQFDNCPKTEELLVLPIEEAKGIEEPTLIHKLPPIAIETPLQLTPLPVEIAQTPPPSPSEPKLTPAAAALQEVIVKKGDSLEKIARAHKTTVDAIIKLNQLPSTFLKIGQKLKIPEEKKGTKGISQAVSLKNPEYYTIKVGENPWAIAQRNKMKVEELLKLNGLNEEKARKLKPGDRLRIR